jgi:serine/threonine-protein kinase
MVMGTPLYLSPEQARGDKVDPATDIYSLGAMAFEMFTGVVPFNADSAVEIMAQHISRPPIPPSSRRPGLPPHVDALVMAMMAKDPRQRPSLDDIRAQLNLLRPMFVGVAAPNASTVMAVQTPHSGPGWGAQQAPSWPAQPAPGQVTMPLAGTSSHPYAQQYPATSSAGGSKKGLVIALVVLALIGGGVGVFVATQGGGDGGEKVAAAEPTEATPGETKTTEAKPAEAKPAETKPAETKPAETKPTETKPAETKPAETKPTETTPIAPTPPALGIVNVTIAGGVQATISVDGKVVATKAATAKLELPPGEHAIRVEAPRRKPYDAKLVVDASKPSDLAIDLPKLGGKPGTKPTTKQTDVDAVADPFAN